MLDFEDDLNEIRDRIEQLGREALEDPDSDVARELAVLRLELEARTADVYSSLTPWQRVQVARHTQRPHTLDYIERLFPDFVELHGSMNSVFENPFPSESIPSLVETEAPPSRGASCRLP